MKFDIMTDANDPKNARKPGSEGTSIGSKHSTGKKENLWKGRFDRRKVAREVPIDFPTPNSDENTEKPAND